MLPPIIILGVLGLLFGIGLYIASKVFHVHVDPRVEKVEACLPGANCGACGLAGCGGFAKAIVHGHADITSCIPGGDDVAHQIADIMGVEVAGSEKQVAILHCKGREVNDKYDYKGIRSCAAANLLHGGPKECVYGCIAFGDCVKACPFDALHMVNGFPVVDEEKCTACGKCVAACPKNLFSIQKMKSTVHVTCKSMDKPKDARKVCKVACIGCGKCTKVCKFDAIYVENFLARIDYDKCVSCGLCEKECPTNAIVNLRIERKDKGLWPVKKIVSTQ
ncbi:RnfABCDGE type electron transport complex subunit B [bacterium]|nr:RnfABCDGE type electron transport complex subunit B [bacterium]